MPDKPSSISRLYGQALSTVGLLAKNNPHERKKFGINSTHLFAFKNLYLQNGNSPAVTVLIAIILVSFLAQILFAFSQQNNSND